MNVISPLLVLHTTRFADDKLIADCLSPTEGRVALVVRISHSPRAKVRHSLFQPLALLEAEWTARPRGGPVAAKSARVLVPLLSVHSHPIKTTIALFLAEVLLHIVRNDAANEHLFAFAQSGLEWLDTAEGNFANFHIVFLMRLSLFLGITPNIEHTTLPYFDLMAGEFRAQPPTHRYYIEGFESEAFAQLLRMNFGTMHLFALSRGERRRILFLILEYYRLHLTHFPELRSLEVMNEIFS
ncbi:MAG: DNA repair protein RecO C-terminal domain-containing protein [Bacteroidaceae bacterium]|nr:DNA repair protein RecO C-terminal domain-containing protein [Bacteroidaceae bacterium]MCF0236278.1 DNA repair protein RecO C-terminal domain-containing protein [Bacteroidaceae bacterium]